MREYETNGKKAAGDKSLKLLEAFSAVDDKLLEQYDHIVQKRLKVCRYRRNTAFFCSAALASTALLCIIAAAALHMQRDIIPHKEPGGNPLTPSATVLPAEESEVGETATAGPPDELEDIKQNTAGENIAGNQAEITEEGQKVMEEERIGDLYLGMTENELIQLLGEPKEISNSGVVIDEYGYRRICWWYDLGSDNIQYRADVQLELIDCGDGFFINTIYLLPEAELTLLSGIRIGSSSGDVERAYPKIERDEAGSGYNIGGLSGLRFYMENETVKNIELGSLIPYPPEVLDKSPEPLPYDFASEHITVYVKSEDSWTAEELNGWEVCKPIEVIMGIEDLTELESVPLQPMYYLDFHNGTLAVLYGSDESGSIYTLSDSGGFQEALLSGGDTAQYLTPVKEAVRFPADTFARVQRALGRSEQ